MLVPFILSPDGTSRWLATFGGTAGKAWSSPSPRYKQPHYRSPRWQRVYNAGARPQRLLWASTGTKDSKAADLLYIQALAAPFTVNTMPEGTLNALVDHGELSGIMPADGGDCETVLEQFPWSRNRRCPGHRLQEEGAKGFTASWNELMGVITSKCATMQKTN